jgi:phosphatidylinositol phospholipase C delta
MTSKILFKDIIKAIKLFLNFHPDTFPLILSFENHSSIPYQEVMAEQLIYILGDSLYVPNETSLLGLLPTPEE